MQEKIVRYNNVVRTIRQVRQILILERHSLKSDLDED